MGIMQPGDKLSRGISTANFVVLSLDGARELRDFINEALAQHEAGHPERVREQFAAKHEGAKPLTAARGEIDNLEVVIYDDDTDQDRIAEIMAKRTIADALQTMKAIKTDAANSPIGRAAPLN